MELVMAAAFPDCYFLALIVPRPHSAASQRRHPDPTASRLLVFSILPHAVKIRSDRPYSITLSTLKVLLYRALKPHSVHLYSLALSTLNGTLML